MSLKPPIAPNDEFLTLELFDELGSQAGVPVHDYARAKASRVIGDGTSDIPAILAAQADAITDRIGLNFGHGRYYIDEPIPMLTSVRASGGMAGGLGCQINALTGFKGVDGNVASALNPSALLDWGATAGAHTSLEYVQLNANFLAGVSHEGNMSAGAVSTGAGLNTVIGCHYIQSAPGVYSITSGPFAGGQAGPGAYTGRTMINCWWDNCAQWMSLQAWAGDDLVGIGLRFNMLDTNRPTDFVLRTKGTNVKLINGYARLFNSNASANADGWRSVMLTISAEIFELDGFYWESNNHNFTHLVEMPDNTRCKLRLKRQTVRMATTALRAMVGCKIADGALSAAADYARLEIEDLHRLNLGAAGADLTPAALEVLTATAAFRQLQFNFRGLDDFTRDGGDLLVFDPASTADAGPIVTLDGSYAGKSYHHYVSPAGGTTTLVPNDVDSLTGVFTGRVTGTFASAASPGTFQATLPQSGLYEVDVVAKVGGSSNNEHVFMGRFLVSVLDGSANDVNASSSIATAKSTEGANTFQLDALTVASVTAAGVVTFNATWLDGASHSVYWIVNYRKMSGTT